MKRDPILCKQQQQQQSIGVNDENWICIRKTMFVVDNAETFKFKSNCKRDREYQKFKWHTKPERSTDFLPSRFVSMKINSLPSFRKKNLKFKTVIKINWYTYIYMYIYLFCVHSAIFDFERFALENRRAEFKRKLCWWRVRELIYVNFSLCVVSFNLCFGFRIFLLVLFSFCFGDLCVIFRWQRDVFCFMLIYRLICCEWMLILYVPSIWRKTLKGHRQLGWH